MGTSQVTYATMVPREGNETLRPLGIVPCFRRRSGCILPAPFYTVVMPVVTSLAVAFFFTHTYAFCMYASDTGHADTFPHSDP